MGTATGFAEERPHGRSASSASSTRETPGQLAHDCSVQINFHLRLRSAAARSDKAKGQAHLYGVLERQFRRYFVEADRRRGSTGVNLLTILESRLDNVVYRMGFWLDAR